MFEPTFVALFRLHSSLQPTGDEVAPCSIESFSGGSYCSPLSDVVA